MEVPGGVRKIAYDPLQRTGVGVSRLGTTEAVAMARTLTRCKSWMNLRVFEFKHKGSKAPSLKEQNFKEELIWWRNQQIGIQ